MIINDNSNVFIKNNEISNFSIIIQFYSIIIYFYEKNKKDKFLS